MNHLQSISMRAEKKKEKEKQSKDANTLIATAANMWMTEYGRAKVGSSKVAFNRSTCDDYVLAMFALSPGSISDACTKVNKLKFGTHLD